MNLKRICLLAVFAAIACTVFVPTACDIAKEPSYVHTAVLRGGAYERGLEHGKMFAADIKSLYTRLLTASILPFLDREQINIAPILNVYNAEKYRGGNFAYRMLLESGRHLYDNYIPEDVRQEMKGIADGSGMEFDKVLVLNTFVDTMMAFRAVVIFIKYIQTPHVTTLDFTGGLGADKVDNDDDGTTDEDGEGSMGGLSPSPWASMLEVPPDASIHIVYEDAVLGGLACPDPRNIDPIGLMEVERDCVADECVLPECEGLELVGRECLNGKADTCLFPRLPGECFDPDCLEIADPGCVDTDSIRIRVNGKQYLATDDALQIKRLPWTGDEPSPGRAPESNPHRLECQGPVDVVFTPPGGFEPASAVSMLLQVGDESPIYSPAPFHSRYMRDERLTFTTRGYADKHGAGSHLYEVGNRGIEDPAVQPPALSFAVRGSATKDGKPLLAHHFALLDSDMVHEHSALLVHVPDDGNPYVLMTWTGLTWGFSGMNDKGLVFAVNTSDSLDSPLVGGMLEDILKPENLLALLENPDLVGLAAVLKERHLLATGLPAGIAGLELLKGNATVKEAMDFLYRSKTTFGWNFLLADATGDIAAVEVDSAVQDDSGGPGASVEDRDGFQSYSPDASQPANLDPHGRLWASEGPDDLRMTSFFRKNIEDMKTLDFMGMFSPIPQRVWTGTYFRSVRAWHLLGDRIRDELGRMDVSSAIGILRTPELVDERDSMNAVVFEPAARRLHRAMGVVPATDADFVAFDLLDAIKGVAQ